MKFTIEIHWVNAPERLEHVLKKEAVSRISEMIQEGYVEGELTHNKDQHVRGYWRSRREEE